MSSRKKSSKGKASGSVRPKDRLRALFDDLNRRDFDGELPRRSIQKSLRGAPDAFYDPFTETIRLAVGLKGEHLRRALLHAMIHLKTGGAHDDCFFRELRRIALLGEPAAKLECAMYDEGVRVRQIIINLATAHPRLQWNRADAKPMVARAIGVTSKGLLILAPWWSMTWRKVQAGESPNIFPIDVGRLTRLQKRTERKA